MCSASIYVHIPFCKQACHYCDFHFSTNLQLKPQLLRAIVQELKMQQGYLGPAQITSVYLGGGTPSLLEVSEVAILLTLIRQLFPCKELMEVTLEANPDDITLNKLLTLKSVGINRLSIGIQSFHHEVLRYLNRVHNSASALASVAVARKAGFDNLSIDLIYAIPGVSQAMWESDLATAMALRPTHIAAYCLTIEKNTAFGVWYQKGKLKAVADEVAAQQFETLLGVMEAHGYEHYEVSNFCQPGYYAQHNTNYWKQGTYLGVGPGAHSYNGKSRQYNVAHNQRYIESIQQGVVPCTLEVLSRENHINEYIMTSLRTQWGCDLAWLKAQYDYDLEQNMYPYLESLVRQGLALQQGYKLLLTPRGKLLADQIATDLFIA